MKRQGVLCALALAVVLCAAACTELPEQGRAEGVAANLSVPAEWGSLVEVTRWDHAFQLWFESADGTIRMAVYNSQSLELQPLGVTISRSGGGAP